ncbi:MAG TPA: mechanosensitive ion channel family protein, partial [Verrucomicrobiae bacterium]|nr:mechanosensitive ion channel family protein [Verrucomicrobiae bacterium]
LNRTTPSSSILAFLQAAQSGNYTLAAQYLQMSAAHRQSEGEQYASELKIVMDRAFNGRVGSFTQPEGVPQEGVPLGEQKIGTMSSGDIDVDLVMVRVNDPSAGKVWLVSAETLAKVPELYDQVQARQVESKLPSFLVKHQLAGMPLWQWLALILALPLAAGAGWIIVVILGIPWRWWVRRRGQADLSNWRSVSPPAWLIAATLLHQFFARYIGMPVLQRHYYFEITSVLLIVGGTWILWRLVRWFLRRVRTRALARGLAGTGSLMLLGERIIKAAVFIAGVFAVLYSLGVDLTTAFAGLGITGLAIGFGAQQTIANLFGGVSVLGDEVIRVGDVCTFGDRTGTVEDIGLRSTRVRTEDRTLLAIPNGTVATINVENLSRRDKILLKTALKLRPETKADHVRWVLAEVRSLLYSHPKVESRSVRVRLTDVAGGSLNVEVYGYIMTRDYNEFAAVREDLLLRMLDIIDDSGGTLATPSQTLYIKRDPGLDPQKAEAAAKKIAELRENNKLPFPDHHPDDVSSMKDSIQYPPPESAVRKDSDPH